MTTISLIAMFFRYMIHCNLKEYMQHTFSEKIVYLNYFNKFAYIVENLQTSLNI